MATVSHRFVAPRHSHCIEIYKLNWEAKAVRAGKIQTRLRRHYELSSPSIT